MIRRLALPLAALVAGAAFAQTAPTPTAPAAAPTPAATVQVTLTTSEGPIILALEKDKAPITTANFLHYVDAKRFDGTTFYRTVKVADGFGLVQGGIGQDPKKAFPPIRHEPTTKTGLSHVDGAISMAMNAPGTARGDFFIMVGASPSMDATATQPGYAVFGRVVQGMDIARRILDAPTDPNKGKADGMANQIIAAPIKIISARRTNTPITPPAPPPPPAPAS
ncbi:peptidylprolyl isomerase [Sphingomonas sp. CGMCC 1.13654]|uniref:peptidylprolyl isomerase n=1 Tax=Sphingomonas chungangi TaxID=2683589 RepID=A0A838L9P9_9SPHN|nr:peptidylprolyl isomerase [Sphingomonas chungangi]MBA2935991.1 peptidylprolyl isomerase [Sphingomonas chungangi]MVW55381.1 peptidylprolyl isomerase [Sphingomonas chungangi]